MPPRTMIALAKLKAATTNEPLPPPPLSRQHSAVPDNELADQRGAGNRVEDHHGKFQQLYFGIRTQLRIEVLRELFAENLQFGLSRS